MSAPAAAAAPAGSTYAFNADIAQLMSLIINTFYSVRQTTMQARNSRADHRVEQRDAHGKTHTRLPRTVACARLPRVRSSLAPPLRERSPQRDKATVPSASWIEPPH